VRNRYSREALGRLFPLDLPAPNGGAGGIIEGSQEAKKEIDLGSTAGDPSRERPQTPVPMLRAKTAMRYRRYGRPCMRRNALELALRPRL
jgi:hypothetical protein